MAKKSDDTEDERIDYKLAQSHLTRKHAHDGARQRRKEGAQHKK
jgi:hypothetical protein